MNTPYDLYKVGLKNHDLIMKLMIYFSFGYRDALGESLSFNDKSVTNFLDRYYKTAQGGYTVNGFDVIKEVCPGSDPIGCIKTE